MNIFRRDCCSKPPRVIVATSARAACACGIELTLIGEDFRFDPPQRPVLRVTFPVMDPTPSGPFARLHFYRKIVGSRTRGGQTEILCRYGEDIEMWYPVAA